MRQQQTGSEQHTGRRGPSGDAATAMTEELRGLQDGAPYAREPLTVRLLAEPSAVAELRRRVRSLFADWGLPEHADTAQLCVSELATNVVTHVGEGVPVTLRVSMAGDRPRIELTDPDPRALPTLLTATDDAESGRGLALLDALTLRWGVTPHADSKTTWCELAPCGPPRIGRP